MKQNFIMGYHSIKLKYFINLVKHSKFSNCANCRPYQFLVDYDLLSDYDEVITYSSNPNLADTDEDGLSDSEEVNTYSTDPNDTDSTGDGFNDGFLVTQGRTLWSITVIFDRKR